MLVSFCPDRDCRLPFIPNISPRTCCRINLEDAPVRRVSIPVDPIRTVPRRSIDFPSHSDSFARPDFVITLVSKRRPYTDSRFCCPLFRRELHGVGHSWRARSVHRRNPSPCCLSEGLPERR